MGQVSWTFSWHPSSEMLEKKQPPLQRTSGEARPLGKLGIGYLPSTWEEGGGSAGSSDGGLSPRDEMGWKRDAGRKAIVKPPVPGSRHLTVDLPLEPLFLPITGDEETVSREVEWLAERELNRNSRDMAAAGGPGAFLALTPMSTPICYTCLLFIPEPNPPLHPSALSFLTGTSEGDSVVPRLSPHWGASLETVGSTPFPFANSEPVGDQDMILSE